MCIARTLICWYFLENFARDLTQWQEDTDAARLSAWYRSISLKIRGTNPNRKPIVSLVRFTAAKRHPTVRLLQSSLFEKYTGGWEREREREREEKGRSVGRRYYAASSVERCISIANDPHDRYHHTPHHRSRCFARRTFVIWKWATANGRVKQASSRGNSVGPRWFLRDTISRDTRYAFASSFFRSVDGIDGIVRFRITRTRYSHAY